MFQGTRMGTFQVVLRLPDSPSYSHLNHITHQPHHRDIYIYIYISHNVLT